MPIEPLPLILLVGSVVTVPVLLAYSRRQNRRRRRQEILDTLARWSDEHPTTQD